MTKENIDELLKRAKDCFEVKMVGHLGIGGYDEYPELVVNDEELRRVLISAMEKEA